MPQNAQTNILVVDDMMANIIAMRRLLKINNLNLLEATSGDEALATLKEYDVALVLLDVQMPNMNGYEVAKQIHKRKETKETPIIFLTSNAVDVMDALKGYESGCIDYIYKPFNKGILLSKIKFFVDLYQQKEQHKSTIQKLKVLKEKEKISRLQTEKATHEKNRLLTCINKEMSAPLKNILESVDLLQKTELTQKQKHYNDSITQSGNALLTFISDIVTSCETRTLDLKENYENSSKTSPLPTQRSN